MEMMLDRHGPEGSLLKVDSYGSAKDVLMLTKSSNTVTSASRFIWTTTKIL
jgi:hypothetical protein